MKMKKLDILVRISRNWTSDTVFSARMTSSVVTPKDSMTNVRSSAFRSPTSGSRLLSVTTVSLPSCHVGWRYSVTMRGCDDDLRSQREPLKIENNHE